MPRNFSGPILDIPLVNNIGDEGLVSKARSWPANSPLIGIGVIGFICQGRNYIERAVWLATPSGFRPLRYIICRPRWPFTQMKYWRRGIYGTC